MSRHSQLLVFWSFFRAHLPHHITGHREDLLLLFLPLLLVALGLVVGHCLAMEVVDLDPRSAEDPLTNPRDLPAGLLLGAQGIFARF